MSEGTMSLPADVVYELFASAALDDPPGPTGRRDLREPSRTYDLGWIKLTHVCRLWRAVGLGTASLWATIVTAFDDAAIAEELSSRARNCTLSMEMIGGWDVRSYRAQRTTSAFEWAVAHLNRAHSLHCSLLHYLDDDHVQPLYPVLDGRHFPALRDLIVESERSSRLDPLVILILDAPMLLCADLKNALPSPTSSALQNLRALTLNMDIGALSLSLVQLIALFRATPRLVKLSLMIFHRNQRFNTSVWYSDFSSEVEDVHLDHLETLSIACSESTQALDIWSYIHAAGTTGVIISITNKGSTAPEKLFGRAFERQLSYTAYGALSVSAHHIELSTCKPTAPRATFHVNFQLLSISNYAELLSAMAVHAVSGRISAIVGVRELAVALPYRSRAHDLDATILLAAGALHESIGDHLEQALLSLGQVLTNVTTLALSSSADSLAFLGYIVRRPLPLCLPALETLRFSLGRGVLGFLGGREKGVQLWWNEMKDFLARRRNTGPPIPAIEIVGQGERCQRAQWTQIADVEVEACHSRGLLRELVDMREWEVGCVECQK